MKLIKEEDSVQQQGMMAQQNATSSGREGRDTKK